MIFWKELIQNCILNGKKKSENIYWSTFQFSLNTFVKYVRVSKHFEWGTSLNVIESDSEDWNNTNASKWEYETCLVIGDVTFVITASYKIQIGSDR